MSKKEILLLDDLKVDGLFPRLNRRLRLGVVGGGRISVVQAMAARLSSYWEVVAGSLSSSPERSLAKGKDWYFSEDRCYSSYQEMANRESSRSDGIDAVMITTPNHLHYDVSHTFIKVGIHVLCDKPMVNHFSEAVALVDQVKNSKVVFGVSYVMASFPMIRQARQLVLAGKIGKVNQIHVEFMQDWMVQEGFDQAKHVKWRLDPKQSGLTSCTGDIGTHAHHLASFVSGLEMSHLRAEMHVCGTPKDLEDTVFMLVRYQDRVPGTLIATRLAQGNRGGLRLRIYGDKGGIEWDLEQPEKLKFNQLGHPDQLLSRGHGYGVSKDIEKFFRLARGFSEGMIEAWANLYSEFAVKIANQHNKTDMPSWTDFPTVEEGAQGVRFIEAALESNQNNGKWVSCHTDFDRLL